MKKSPAYFKWCEDNPQSATLDLMIGSAFHKIVLEPDDFDNEFIVEPKYDRRTKEGKLAYNHLMELIQGGLQIITEEQYEMICGMRDSIMSNRYAVSLLKGERENSMYFVDDLTQEPCKVRPDCWRRVGDRVVITDLKSCKSAMPEDFMQDVVKFSYDLQAYQYCLGASKVLNVPIQNIDFVFIAVEKNAPYLLNIMQANQIVLDRGESLFRKYIGLYHECKTEGIWYGLNGKFGAINDLTLPNYLTKDKEINQ